MWDTLDLGSSPGEEDCARLSVRSNPHDFGTYLSVACRYAPDVSAAVDYAFRCEAEGPREWDDEARRELSLPPETLQP